MAQIKKKVGGGQATVGGILADPSKISNAVAAQLAPFVESEALAILANARALWPVYSGKSKGALSVQKRAVVGSRVEYLVGTVVDYGYYIRSTKVGKEKDATRLRNVFQELIRKPTIQANKRIADEAIRLSAEVISDA